MSVATYGTMNGEEKTEKLPLVGFNGKETSVNLGEVFDPNRPFDENYDEQFWLDVAELYKNGKNKISHAKAQRTIRLKRLKEKLEDGQDLMVHLLTTIHDRYMNYCLHEKKMDLYPTFVFELSEFVVLLLRDDMKATAEGEECEYEQLLEVNDDMKSVLHLAAERNLTQIAEYAISLHPNLVYVTTLDDEYPLNFALLKKHDDIASLLIDSMENGRVRDLFEANEMRGAVFKFKDIILDGTMKKTVVAILDCLMNPDWPFIPTNKNDEETGENPYSVFPNTPVRYHFYYNLLDGDDEGRNPFNENKIYNEHFNRKSKSCLQLLAESSVKEDAVRHAAVRLLVRKKWDAYGLTNVRRHFYAYLLFLVLMSLAFFLHRDTSSSPLQYTKAVDYVRLVCEIATLFFTFVYLLSEFDQMEKERSNYLSDIYNYFDLGGMALLILVIPLRFADVPRVEWAISAAAYFINFLRIFKHFPAFKSLGLYSKTFAKIIYADISKFLVVFAVVVMAFTGAVFLALKASNSLSNVGGFWDLFLIEVRVLTEGQGFADSYDNYNVFLIIFIMVNMFCVLIVLVNILIGQISNRYEIATENAAIQYDVDKTKLVTKIENSRFLCWNQRIKHYEKGGFVNIDSLEKELLDDWIELKKSTSKTDENRKAVKLMISRKVQRIRKHELTDQNSDDEM